MMRYEARTNLKRPGWAGAVMLVSALAFGLGNAEQSDNAHVGW